VNEKKIERNLKEVSQLSAKILNWEPHENKLKSLSFGQACVDHVISC